MTIFENQGDQARRRTWAPPSQHSAASMQTVMAACLGTPEPLQGCARLGWMTANDEGG